MKTSGSPEKFFLFDVSSLLFRAYFAIPPLSNAEGVPTNAVYGFLNMVLKVLRSHKPQYLAFCYDSKEPSFRKDLFEDYKAHRLQMPDDLALQIPYVYRLTETLGIRSLSLPGYEADDLIGALVHMVQPLRPPTLDGGLLGPPLPVDGYVDAYIVSSDKDFAQLVGPHVYLYDTMKEVVYDEKKVYEKWGVHCHQFTDYLALTGDSSDNVPGVKGIGAKGAQALLAEFGSLEKIYEHLDQIKKNATRENLRLHKEEAFLSKRLVTIVHHIDGDDLDLGQLPLYRHKGVHLDPLLSLVKELNFRSLEKNIHLLPTDSEEAGKEGVLVPPSTGPQENSTGHSITSLPWSEFHKKIHRGEAFRVWALDINQAHQSLELAFQALKKPPVEGAKADRDLTPAFICCSLTSQEDKDSLWIRAHENADSWFWHGFDLKGFWRKMWPPPWSQPQDISLLSALQIGWDSLLGAYLLRAGESLEFETLTLNYPGSEGGGEGTGQNPSHHLLSQLIRLEEETKREVQEKLRPSTSNLDPNLALTSTFGGEGSSDNGLSLDLSWEWMDILKKVDFPLSSILCEMEIRGIQIQEDFLLRQSEELREEIHRLEAQAQTLARVPDFSETAEVSEPFNLSSPKQLAQVLFERLGLPPIKRTKTGLSTDNEVLEKLMKKAPHPLIPIILQHRELSKIRSTYVESLLSLKQRDGRVHTTFNQALTSTGRLSSTDPNIQNIPIRTERGAQIRKAFVAPSSSASTSSPRSGSEKTALLSADYSQIELRILAHMSQDPHLTRAFEEDKDVHTITALEIFGPQMTPEFRRRAKAVNFGIAYGQGAFGLSESLGISRGEAQAIIDRYFERFPGVKNYMEAALQSVRALGYVETLIGRRRYIPSIRSQDQTLRRFAERAAINAPIQGTASDIVKLAMVKIRHSLPENSSIHLLLQVHDELVFEGWEEELHIWAPKIVKMMEEVVPLRVPLRVHYGIGSNWEEAHE